MRRKRKNNSADGLAEAERVAANGLLHRRAFLGGGASLGAALTGYTLVDPASAAPLPVEDWMRIPGAPLLPYDRPSKYEAKTTRGTWASRTGFDGVGSLRTPHHLLTGTITPSGLHFSRIHSGVPDIDPNKHRLLIHGLVKRPLVFTLDALTRYPMESRIYFLECGGNSELMYRDKPAQVGVQRLCGQMACS